MATANEHARTLLSAIIPARRDLLDRATRHLTPEHFLDPVLRNIFVMLCRYADVTGAIMSKAALGDMLAQVRADAGKVALYTETYDLLVATAADEAQFRWSLEQIRELSAERATGEALTQGMAILTGGATGERGELLRGHSEARNHVLAKFAQIDHDLSMMDSPEGDMRAEAEAMLSDYAERKAARAAGRNLGVSFGIPALDETTNGLQRGELCLLVGYPGEGKAQPLDAPVLTPRGWTPMGELRVGDEVIDPQGRPSQVVGVYPQGTRPVYRLMFSDGSQAEATDDHLWEVETWQPVRVDGVQTGAVRKRVVWTTKNLAFRLSRGSRSAFLVGTPGLAQLDFPEQPLPLDAYALGLLIGDGSLNRAPTFTAHDSDYELVQALEAALPPGVVLNRGSSAGGTTSYRLCGLPVIPPCRRCAADRSIRARGLCDSCYETTRSQGGLRQYPLIGHRASIMNDILCELGLSGTHSWDKFVPEQYKWASAKTRLSMLQGLMDTDGWHQKGAAQFSSASRRLRDDVVWLARSLGLRAAPVPDKASWYVNRAGERRAGRTAYQCRIWEKPDVRVFRLARKLKPMTLKGGRKLVSVEYVRDAECQCIKVSAPSQLYVTGDFVPTHNTSAVVQLGWHASVGQGLNTVILTTETLRPQVRRRILARHSCLPQFGVPGGLNSRDIKTGLLSPSNEEALRAVIADFTGNAAYGRCWITQVPHRATVGYLESKLLRLSRMFPIDLVIMDYLALLRADRKRRDQREELSDIIKEAKQLATTFHDGYGVPFVSPWQVSRAARREAERVGYYTSDALAETSEATNSADVIISLLAPLDFTGREAQLKMQVMKNRDGERAAAIDVGVDYATSRFLERRRGQAMDHLLGDDITVG